MMIVGACRAYDGKTFDVFSANMIYFMFHHKGQKHCYELDGYLKWSSNLKQKMKENAY